MLQKLFSKVVANKTVPKLKNKFKLTLINYNFSVLLIVKIY